ncbi:hypothetical protein DPMN_152180 [Dreissena polymorpha]|uniref:Uncharacterized protein n=1 Tax=Dreissena polymorpha TaxID=45954 RepID=A0A9D4FH07_DREPO|nr:hypothetical protein DPMN_152180 [Dreissena polymorpha]
MIEMGPNVILRLEKIRRSIVASPEPMLWFSKRRLEMEMLFLEEMNRVQKCINENGGLLVPDFMCYAIRKRQRDNVRGGKTYAHEGLF